MSGKAWRAEGYAAEVVAQRPGKWLLQETQPVSSLFFYTQIARIWATKAIE
jgi:hypothetical protein